METEPLVVLTIVDALLVALFFLFRVPEAVRAADTAMYVSKTNGGSRVTVAEV